MRTQTKYQSPDEWDERIQARRRWREEQSTLFKGSDSYKLLSAADPPINVRFMNALQRAIGPKSDGYQFDGTIFGLGEVAFGDVKIKQIGDQARMDFLHVLSNRSNVAPNPLSDAVKEAIDREYNSGGKLYGRTPRQYAEFMGSHVKNAMGLPLNFDAEEADFLCLGIAEIMGENLALCARFPSWKDAPESAARLVANWSWQGEGVAPIHAGTTTTERPSNEPRVIKMSDDTKLEHAANAYDAAIENFLRIYNEQE